MKILQFVICMSLISSCGNSDGVQNKLKITSQELNIDLTNEIYKVLKIDNYYVIRTVDDQFYKYKIDEGSLLQKIYPILKTDSVNHIGSFINAQGSELILQGLTETIAINVNTNEIIKTGNLKDWMRFSEVVIKGQNGKWLGQFSKGQLTILDPAQKNILSKIQDNYHQDINGIPAVFENKIVSLENNKCITYVPDFIRNRINSDTAKVISPIKGNSLQLFSGNLLVSIDFDKQIKFYSLYKQNNSKSKLIKFKLLKDLELGLKTKIESYLDVPEQGETNASLQYSSDANYFFVWKNKKLLVITFKEVRY